MEKEANISKENGGGDEMTTGERIRDLRQGKGVTQAELDKILKVPSGTVAGWENNEGIDGLYHKELVKMLILFSEG